jgi:hypothetical protein
VPVEFDATLDEAIDVHVRAARRTSAFRRQRLINQWSVGLACALVLAGVTFREAPRPVTLLAFCLVSAFAAAVGLVVAFLYGWYLDNHVRRYTKRSLVEQYGGPGPFPTQFEIRPEGLWAKSKALEITFPWSNLDGIEERGGDVELTFRPGFVVIRARAFSTPEDRARFIAGIRQAADVS